ncbi:hypothetical protein LYNGBM3L_43510 [Moorena producens 3L]|uniref:Uncharacterized protein n=1 Tax=Moorena producens 3L TaxID=489825 RepID=F4XWI9_9CYAN|nr:hypothetical protein LYNGBM3L_43510 [Moorena producens 3L]
MGKSIKCLLVKDFDNRSLKSNQEKFTIIGDSNYRDLNDKKSKIMV